MPSTLATQPIGLTEFIYQVKRELMKPEEAVTDPIPFLAIEEVELELSVIVTAKTGGALDIQVVQLGRDTEHNKVHTVRVKLSPLLTREERVAELRKEPTWSKIVIQQGKANKGSGIGASKDQI